MKTLFSVLTALIIAFQPLGIFAQDDEIDDLGFEETTYEPKSQPYFAVGGGYIGSLFFPDLGPVNTLITDNNFDMDELDGFIYTQGFEVFTVTFIVPNLRTGFFSQAGSKQVDKGGIIINETEYNRSIEYAVNYQGIIAEYAFMPFSSLAIIPGVRGGWGTLAIEAYQGNDNITGNFEPGSSDEIWLNRIRSNFLFVQPQLNIEFAFTDFFMARLSANYNLASMGDWKLNRKTDFPDSDIEASGLSVQFGIFVGLFNY